MTTQDIGLFQALGAKMDFLNQRQSVIAQNIANADTPGYVPKDLSPVDFSSMLGASAGAGKSSVPSVGIAKTNGQHLAAAGAQGDVKTHAQRNTYEVAPAGNAVVIEEQLVNSSKNVMDYNLMLNIYHKQVAMLRTAIGAN